MNTEVKINAKIVSEKSARRTNIDHKVVQNHENNYQMMPKGCPNAFKSESKRPTWSQKGAKVSQGTFKNINCGTGSTKIEVLMDSLDRKREPFLSNSINKSHQKSFLKTITPKHGI